MKINYVGRLGRRLLAQADASQLIDTADPASGQLLSTAFTNLTKQARTNAAMATPQPFFEAAGAGATQFLYSNFFTFAQTGDFADFVQQAAAAGIIRPNAGMASQFAYNSYLTNKGFSSYNGLLFTLNKNLSQGLQFDFNYTWSHSVDNTSLVANSIAANTGLGFICDVVRPRACRGNSDFDIQNVINADFVYDLPVGRKRMFLANAPRIVDQLIGGWQVSGIPQYRSGQAFTATSGAFVAGYASNAPAIFVGKRGDAGAHPFRNAKGTVNLFSNTASLQAVNGGATGEFIDPLGFTIGSRNALRGPSSISFDAGLAKTFGVIDERLNAKFRADAFNVLNHPVFALPSTTNVNSSSFGNITAVAVAARVLQVSLRLEF